ncbi:MAG: glycosyltransferase family 2 protein [Candidatus Buchananbacteria bacterium]|nr:glycosyltransferase family 2 protein [Candidatus Buchananbacteria bacterium]
MDLSIIIVSWNTKDLLKKCLLSVYQNQGDLAVEIFVIDNNSNDKTVEMLRNEFKEVKLMANSKNIGFAKANNQALKLAQGEYILLLNPDTEILNGSLKKAVAFMKANAGCGALGAKLLWPDKSLQLSVRRFPTFLPIFLMFIKAPKLFKRIKSIERYLYADFDYTRLQEVDQIMGAFMMLPKKVVAKIGFLDERFFIWFEEVDLCQRIKKSGLQVIYNPDIEIIHYGGQSFAQEKIIKKQWLFFQSAIRYFLKNGFFNH